MLRSSETERVCESRPALKKVYINTGIPFNWLRMVWSMPSFYDKVFHYLHMLNIFKELFSIDKNYNLPIVLSRSSLMLSVYSRCQHPSSHHHHSYQEVLSALPVPVRLNTRKLLCITFSVSTIEFGTLDIIARYCIFDKLSVFKCLNFSSMMRSYVLHRLRTACLLSRRTEKFRLLARSAS